MTGMGNVDLGAVMTGLVVEVQIGKVSLLVSGGYQNKNTFHSGSYGGSRFIFRSRTLSGQPGPMSERRRLPYSLPP